ncbi:DUF6053 domain-containing protein [Lysobacter enzymogenes]|uniref:DUF6053 domain-containing protein n=1 Tax=Lysobacter enzymogenes TaxID=69 RepID=UPI003D18D883
MGGPSGPMLFFQASVIWNKSIGPEGPPTRAKIRCARHSPTPVTPPETSSS